MASIRTTLDWFSQSVYISLEFRGEIMIIGAEVKKAGRQYSPCDVAMISNDDFIISDSVLKENYNTDVFCDVGRGQAVPVYSNLSDIPLRLPDRSMLKVTDEAYPARARLVDANFRLDYYGSSPSLSTDECHSYGQSVGFVWWTFVIAVVVTGIVVGAVIAIFFSGIHSLLLPGGASGQERMITDKRKLIVYPDGSWSVYDTDTSEVVDSGEKPEATIMTIVIPIVLGVAGIAAIYVFIKWGMPVIARELPKLKPG